MKINADAVRKCLKTFDFATLFREHLGWDNHHARLEIAEGNTTVVLTAVAQKRGFVAFLCPAIPDRPARLKIDHKVTKSVREHFIIYTDEAKGRQVWHWVRREPGKPLASRDHRFDTSQSGTPLIQRLERIAVGMEEEEEITVVDVASRVKAALYVDKITKKFYDRFKTEHAAFLERIKGIETDVDLAWYTSLMLNRLMFVYFIQKKGFLDGDTDYLKTRLAMVQKKRGKDRFQSFYRYFLLRLFHDGLGKSAEERELDPALEKILGRVPYLNGGFFEVHQLEKQYPAIEIPDEAFENLFVFFDQYRWHLDERPLRADNEINPDVVGYIFEKYINQKQMGAYYTKEDITEYIGKNTIVPFVFDAAEKKCPIAFKQDSFLWRLPQEDPDRYIYPAVKHGVIRSDGSVVPETDLPDFVQTGMSDPKARMHDRRYNLQQAPAEDSLRLVAETWREYVDRRNRCLEIREKLQSGAVHQINDFITLNLDIWQFARDAIVISEGPDLLRAFWKTLEKLTVLDPTCGSGAFLFAALRILETLYSDCLERMERFVEDANNKPVHPKQFGDFKNVLAQIGKHPNERYFILKSIILNNLYGVDIMAEAVEICKLRLFLKLVAQVEKADHIEPLPDMDFNIRTGNTLVGYATAEEARKAFSEKADGKQKQATLPFGETVDAYRRFEEDLLVVEKAFQQFRSRQTTHGDKVTYLEKQDLRTLLGKLSGELDRYLAAEYGISASGYKSRKTYEKAFSKWKSSHLPFHWFVEFYVIMPKGGFDVVVGNPPWREYAAVKNEYAVRDYLAKKSGNLYALCTERSLQLILSGGYLSFIVQLPIVSSSRMANLRQYLTDQCRFLNMIPFDDRPGKLFDGLQHCRSTIFIARKKWNTSESDFLTTRYNRWSTDSRDILFVNINFTRIKNNGLFQNQFPKIPSMSVVSAFNKLFAGQRTLVQNIRSARKTDYFIFYQEATQYWVKATSGLPYYAKNGATGAPAHGRYLFFRDEQTSHITCALLNSSVFYMYFVAYGDCFHLSDTLATSVPIAVTALTDRSLSDLNKKLMVDLTINASKKTIRTKTGDEISYDEFNVFESKPIIDQIDQVFAKHYGFTDEELDFIINYDIKYRMGRDSGTEEAE